MFSTGINGRDGEQQLDKMRDKLPDKVEVPQP